MIYSRGKGARVYRSSGFGNYGCLVGLFLMPFQILWVALKTVFSSLKHDN